MASTLDIQAKFSGVIAQSEGGAVFSYLGDEGIGESILITNNQVDASRYPTSARTIRRLRGCAPLGTAGGPITFTLYQNGVATAMTCAIAGGLPAGTKVVDSAHPIVFADGDDFDVRVDSSGLSANVAVSATLEGPPPGP